MQVNRRSKKIGKKNASIPAEAEERLRAALHGLGDPLLSAESRGRYYYVNHGGQPLCRRAYRSDGDLWDLAVYKYSNGGYASLDFDPSPAPADKCIRCAMNIYNLI